jgi:aspartate/glutamate racemase
MKTIGLIGGMSWESSAQYYAIINRAVRERLGGSHSAQILMYSVDFGEIEKLQYVGDWSSLTLQMIEAAQRVEAGGADFVLICTNTMHLMAGEVAAAIHNVTCVVSSLAIASATLTRSRSRATRSSMPRAKKRSSSVQLIFAVSPSSFS